MKDEKALSEDMKSLASNDNIQLRLRGPSNFLAWMEHISSLTQKLPESTSDLKILSLIKNSITNKYNLKDIEEILTLMVEKILLIQREMDSQDLRTFWTAF